MVGSPLADALLRHDATKELRHVLLVDRRAVLSRRLDVDHERCPVRTREQRDRRRSRRERVAGLDRTMDDDVVLVVDDARPRLIGGHRPRGRRNRLPDGNNGEDRASGNVIGRRGVGEHRLLGDAVLPSLTGYADRSGIERGLGCGCLLVERGASVGRRFAAHVVIPVIWPPLAVIT